MDTRNAATQPTIAVTMHRVPSDVFDNAVPGALIDDPLRVKGSALGTLAPSTILQGEVIPNNDPGISFSVPQGGLVADGVTPLLFKITAPANSLPTEGIAYELAVKSLGYGKYTGTGGLVALLRVVDGGFVYLKPTIRLTPSQPTAYAVLGPVDPGKLDTTYLGYAPVVADLEVRELGLAKRVSVFRFGIRKPPVALVHGYNTDTSTWGDGFLGAIRADRGADFVVPVSYGTDNNASAGTDKNSQNTNDALITLAGVLDGALRMQVEKSSAFANWAFTRCDAVGHSQGGVLLRMLCSKKELAGGGDLSTRGFEAFRKADNFYRGRFRRVVTIGSPQAGSTLGELGFQLRKKLGVDYGDPRANKHKSELDPLLQPKFRIGANTQLDNINTTLTCDEQARLYLVAATIYGGQAPDANGSAFDSQLFFYKALYLDRPTPTTLNPTTGQPETPGVLVAPNGSDGVVDFRSQTADGGSTHAITGHNISHAKLGETETSSSTVAQRVITLLNGSASEFGPVTIPQSLKDFMQDRRVRIETLAQKIYEQQRREQNSMYSEGTFVVSRKPALAAAGDQLLNFTLQPPAGESPNGPVEWTAVVYGPAGVNTTGLTLAMSGTFGEQLALTVAASVQGQVVLSVSFLSVTGKTVLGTPGVVVNRPPGSVLTGIALVPAAIQSQVGAEVPLSVTGIYDASVSSSLFVSAANIAFQSSNPNVATVTADGQVQLVAIGTTTITATYNGTLTGTTAVTVLDVAPVVTSAGSVAGTVGQTLNHQLTASQTVQTFAAAPLPPGLTLNSQTGLIAGTPTAQGATSALVSATNANGTGSRQVDFTITGPPGAPTDVGLDAGGVSEQKPVGTLVGRLVTIDPNPLDTFAYQLVAGTGATNNASFAIAGDQVFTAAVLNRAVTPTVSIRVRTTDSSGATFEKAIVLAVMAPPAITRQPDPRRVFAGDPVVFAVEATGLEPLAFQWKKNGANLAGANSRILDLGSADASQAGNYSATVSNGDGTAVSAPAGLIVDPASYGKWLSQVAGATSAARYEPTGDFNKDGVVNFLEFAFGVQPGGSGTAALPVVWRDAAGLVFTYREASGVEPLTYEILQSTNLVTWTPFVPAGGDVSRVNVGAYDLVSVRVPSPNPNLYLKLRVSTGIASSADADGLPDEWEIANWGTTGGHGPLDDFDRDGVAELLEYAFGGNPKNPDSANLPNAVNEGGYLTVTLTKRSGVSYLVETALDLRSASWSAANTTVLIDNSITLKVRDNVPLGGATSRYLRVRVAAP